MKMALLGALAVVFLTAGCVTYRVGVPSDEEGKTYVVKSGGSQTVLLCDAQGGRPVCVEQTEQ
jgi:hypothetical protein